MRKTLQNQLTFGEIDISKIEFDPKSRDDIPQLLKGLQYMYTDHSSRKKIFQILREKISPKVDKNNGRPGMDLWKILVMGVLRLNLNWDYDRLHEMVNNHLKIREMLGQDFFNRNLYHMQTLKDNIALLTPEILDEINQVVVDCGHKLVKKKDQIHLKGRCDSFVVETNVHFPTDANLLFDASRKVISLTAALCDKFDVPGWRQSKHNIKKQKKQLRRIQKLKHSTSKNPNKTERKKQQIKLAYIRYTANVRSFIEKACDAQKALVNNGMEQCYFGEVDYFIAHAERQIEQILRRVIGCEAIPHHEKVFSVFEPHTEWICKGKAGVPVELGIRVAILEDQFGFLLNHCIMQNQTDEKIAIPFVRESKEKFPKLRSCSFDKGFHSPENQEQLRQILDNVALPKKGRLSKKDAANQCSAGFSAAKEKHSAVESAINALEVHGLDRCPDHGIYGFRRYVSAAVLARNIQIIGSVLIKREQRALKRKYKNVA